VSPPEEPWKKSLRARFMKMLLSGESTAVERKHENGSYGARLDIL